MPNDQIADYIKRAKEAGMEDNEIRQNLLGSGFSAMEIEEELSTSGKIGMGTVSPAKKRFSFRFVKPLMVIVVIIALVIGGYYILDRFFPQYAKYVQPYLGPVLDPVLEQIQPLLDEVGLSKPSGQNINQPVGPSNPTPTPLPGLGGPGQSLDFARDWRTYRNFEYGFEFRYPSKYIIKSAVNEDLSATKSIFLSSESDLPSGLTMHFNKDLATDWQADQYNIVARKETKIINNKEWTVIYFYDKNNPEHIYSKGAGITVNNIPYFLVDGTDENYVNLEFDQILSTFKFPPDSDGDGLPDEDEPKYNTNPNNTDTDGDGYLDGQEVQNGYNPLGPGRATQ